MGSRMPQDYGKTRRKFDNAFGKTQAAFHDAFQREGAAELKELFERIDTDKDGKISKSEFEAHYQSVIGDAAERNQIWSRMDNSGSGFATLKSFIAALGGMHKLDHSKVHIHKR